MERRPRQSSRISRLAPSPTGVLHPGNLRTFLLNWLAARRHGWMLRMRVEDLDGPRIQAGSEAAALDLLAWLGLDWDGAILRQSDDLEPYRAAMCRLAARGLVYPCALSRREIEAATSAPHGDEPEPAYPRHLRPALRRRRFEEIPETNWRFAVPDRPIVVADRFAGRHRFDVAASIGDFVVWTKRAQPSYQLAVVIDDARQAVTDVIRGDDLLDSTPRQVLLAEALGLRPRPAWHHLPLVIGPDGKRLAKRHGDTRLATYRAAGVAPDRIIGLLAAWSRLGPADPPVPVHPAQLVERFDWSTVPRRPATFTAENDRWLREIDR